MSAADARWADAIAAAALLAIDPAGLGGAVLRARPGPARDLWLDDLRVMLERPLRRLPLSIDDDRLLGGLDLVATLKAGRAVARAGVLAEANGGVLVAAMAERMEAGAAARIAAVLDRGRLESVREGLTFSAATSFAIVALDEGAEPDERAGAILSERLAFHLDLDGLRTAGRGPIDPDLLAVVTAARAGLSGVAPPGEAAIEALVTAAAAFGIVSLRAPILALRAARAAAALRGVEAIDEEDLILAARLVLAPRALILPEMDAPDQPNPDERPPESSQAEDTPQTLADRVLDAVQAAAPEDLLAQIAANIARQQSRGRAGSDKKGGARGRPAGVRPGKLGRGLRLDIPATLRAAASWQALRRREQPQARAAVLVRAEDFRLQRRIEKSEATTIFVVDASGSAALNRLAECKGAVELLLAQAYVRRTRAALIAFRKTGAETILPPTRSLTRAKRALADLPGGGGTPLASALDAALRLALSERAQGRTPSVVLLTDGRANVTRAGIGAREEAQAQALESARGFKAHAIGVAFIDSSPRPQPEARALSEAMGARYVPLPFPQAKAMADVVKTLAS
ncbi:MAG: magnesium chelatase subunit D [Caulobacterales bacterium]